MIAVLAFSLSACGAEQKEHAENKSEKSVNDNFGKGSCIYEGEDLGGEAVKGYGYSFVADGDKIIFLATEYPDENDQEEGLQEDGVNDGGIARVYSMNRDGSDITEICSPASESKDEFFQKLLPDPDGNYLLFSISSDIDMSDVHYYITRIDKSGDVKERTEISNVIENSQETYITDFFADQKGNYIVLAERTVYILDKKFKKVAEIRSDDGMVNGIAGTPDGKVICGILNDATNCIKELDVDKKQFGKSYKIDQMYNFGTDTFQDGCGSYDFYFATERGVYGYSLEHEASALVLDYMGSQINPDNAFGIVPIDENTMVGTAWNGPEASLMIYKMADEQKAQSKTVITFGAMWGIVDEVKNAAMKFNKENDRYTIEFRDYSSEEDPETKMIADVMAGDGPDIIDLSGVPLTQYARQGVLEDLTPYMEKDQEISKEDLLPSVEKAMEIDGKLYFVSSWFSVRTLLASKKDVGDKNGWTFKEFRDLLSEKGENVRPFQSGDKASMLNNFLYSCMNDYVNWDTGECRFDSDEFKQMLEAANTGTDDERAGHGVEEENLLLGFQNGTVLFWDGYARMEFIQEFKKACGSDATYIGYPCEDKNGSYISFNNQIGIYAKSKEKEGAWEFIRTFLTKELQACDGYIISNPTNKEAFEMFMKSHTATEPYTDEFGHHIEPMKGTFGFDGGEVNTAPLNAEEEKLYRDLIMRTTKTISVDDDVINIIQEEADAYFKGKRSVDETAGYIQNRVSTYVSERM